VTQSKKTQPDGSLDLRVIGATVALVAAVGALAWAATSSPRQGTREQAREDVRAEARRHAEAGGRHDEAGEGRRAPAGRDQAIAAPSDVAAPPAGAERTPSGLASRVLRPGTGTAHPGATSRVTVHYTGWTTDGAMFDSSRTRGEPATFPLDRVIQGWTEGVQLMVVGEQRRFWIPEALAYQGRRGAPAGMLVFDVELLSID